jgi:dihydrofolate synthase/folylpolyglutamate synthase
LAKNTHRDFLDVSGRFASADEPFFREWKNRRVGEVRSLNRARQLARILELDQAPLPILTVVGSKGKATTALYASAVLNAAGLKVGTVTSPPIISNRERIRISGRALDDCAYRDLSSRVENALNALPSAFTEPGYLSPSGLYTLMGLRHFLDQGCDVAVLEAGMGGSSDEVSLFSPMGVAVTKIFGEHLGVLGSNVVEIARDKAGVIMNSTKSVLSLNQSPEIESVLTTKAEEHGCDLTVVDQSSSTNLELIPTNGLSRANAELGIEAGKRLAVILGSSVPDPSRLRGVLSTVNLPGRLSVHTDEFGRRWIVDAAIDGRGMAAALEYAESEFGVIDTILVSLPEGKNIAGAREVLGQRTFVPVSVDVEHLSFSEKSWSTPLVPFEEVETQLKGERILALGTWSFIGSVLMRLRVDWDVAYLP